MSVEDDAVASKKIQTSWTCSHYLLFKKIKNFLF